MKKYIMLVTLFFLVSFAFAMDISNNKANTYDTGNTISNKNNELKVYANNSCIYIEGITEPTEILVEVYTITGSRLIHQKIQEDTSIACNDLKKGVYIVRVGEKATKITIK